MNEVYDHSIAETIVKKALDMREARRHIVHAALTPKPVKSATVKFESNTWIAMGEAILKYHKEAEVNCFCNFFMLFSSLFGYANTIKIKLSFLFNRNVWYSTNNKSGLILPLFTIL